MASFEPEPGLVQRWTGLDPGFEQSYLSHYWRFDPWVEPGLERAIGDSLIGSELISDAALERSVFYSELGRHHGMHRLLGVVLRRNERRAVWCSMMREKSSQDFTLADQRQLAKLTPHLKRACDVAGRLARARAIGVTFEHLPLPVLIVDVRGQVSRITPAAQELLALAHGLVLENGTLVAEVRADNERLRQAIVAAAQRRLNASSSGEPIKLRRPRAGRSALLAHVLPCPEAASPFADQAAMAIVFIVDPDARVAVPTSEIQQALDLTPAEARLAAVVASGAALKEVADKLGITYLTARTQLRSVFSKTGVCRQSELVRLIASLEAHRPGATPV